MCSHWSCMDQSTPHTTESSTSLWNLDFHSTWSSPASDLFSTFRQTHDCSSSWQPVNRSVHTIQRILHLYQVPSLNYRLQSNMIVFKFQAKVIATRINVEASFLWCEHHNFTLQNHSLNIGLYILHQLSTYTKSTRVPAAFHYFCINQ